MRQQKFVTITRYVRVLGTSIPHYNNPFYYVSFLRLSQRVSLFCATETEDQHIHIHFYMRVKNHYTGLNAEH